jgi:hypothetical protein
MEWDTLEKTIPYMVEDGSEGHIDLLNVRREVYAGDGFRVDVSQPGKYWRQTEPKGGDFVIEVTSARAITLGGSTWTSRRFTHTDLFLDTQEKRDHNAEIVRAELAPALTRVVAEGEDPLTLSGGTFHEMPGLEPMAYLMVGQTLALCEHRRYHEHEPMGGRCLPLGCPLESCSDTGRMGPPCASGSKARLDCSNSAIDMGANHHFKRYFRGRCSHLHATSDCGLPTSSS